MQVGHTHASLLWPSMSQMRRSSQRGAGARQKASEYLHSASQLDSKMTSGVAAATAEQLFVESAASPLERSLV